MTYRKTVDRLVYYPQETFDSITELCQKQNISLNKLILSLVEGYIKKHRNLLTQNKNAA